MMESKKKEKIPNAQRIECAEIIQKMARDGTANDIKHDKKSHSKIYELTLFARGQRTRGNAGRHTFRFNEYELINYNF